MTVPLDPTPSAPAQSAARTGTVRRLFTNPLGVVAMGVMLLWFVAAIFATVLTSWSPHATDLTSVLDGPGGEHLLGTDSAGRDVYARLMYGARATFAAGALAAAVAMLIGVPAGLIAGYYRGWFDTGASWTSDMFMSLPAVIVLLAARAALGPSVWYSMTIFGVLLSPVFFRLVRNSVIVVRGELYVDAARVSGLSDARIIGRHVLTVVRAPIIIQAALVAGIAIAIQAGLEFLGLGDINTPTWGMMLNEGFRNVFLSPLSLLWPALAISSLTAAFALFGNALRDALEDDEKPAKVARGRRGPDRTEPPAEVGVQGEGVPSHPAPLLTVHGLTVQYPQAHGEAKRVVEGVSFTVDRGEIVGVVGESGSGKTQTAFSILGLLPQEAQIASGSIVFDGVELVADGGVVQARIDRLRGRRIAYVPQEPMSNLDPSFTVGYQLVRPMHRVLGISKAEAQRRALELLETVGIPDPAKTFDSYPHELSGGMAQRVLIAGAVSCNPDLLIADEPTTALDVTVQAEVLELLRRLQQDTGMGLVLVTHNLGVVADICERVVVMERARVAEQGDVRTILTAPREDYTKLLLASTLEGKEPFTRLIDGQPIGAATSGPVAGDPLLEVDDLVVEYRSGGLRRQRSFTAVRTVSFAIPEGKTLGLVGGSGSGKTTIGRAILGLAPVTAGTVRFDGKDIGHLSTGERRKLSRDIQVVFQDPYSSLNPSLTIGAILAEPLGVQGQSPKQARARVRELLDQVALPADAIDRRPREFSGGQRQRVAIARALALSPRLIVCDEPVSALDLTTQARILDLLLEIQRESNVSYLFVSHDLGVVRHVSHQVAVMHRGELVEQGDARKVTENPAHPYTQRLLVSSPVADPDAQRRRREARRDLAAEELADQPVASAPR